MYRSRAAAIILINNPALTAAYAALTKAESLDACLRLGQDAADEAAAVAAINVRDVAATIDHPDAMRLAAIDFEDRADDLMGVDDLGARLYKAKAWSLAAQVCA